MCFSLGAAFFITSISLNVYLQRKHKAVSIIHRDDFVLLGVFFKKKAVSVISCSAFVLILRPLSSLGSQKLQLIKTGQPHGLDSERQKEDMNTEVYRVTFPLVPPSGICNQGLKERV